MDGLKRDEWLAKATVVLKRDRGWWMKRDGWLAKGTCVLKRDEGWVA